MHPANKGRRRRRHPEVLDSSDEEESCGGSSQQQQQQIIMDERVEQHKLFIPTPTITNTNVGDDSDSSSSAIEDDDDDDEIMNPYIMNPFSSSNANNYSEHALLPPSSTAAATAVEMSTISTNNNNDRGEIMGVKLGLTNISEPTTSLHNKCRQQQSTTTQLFDPYITTNNNQQQQQQQQLEMEMEEESIEFLHGPNYSPPRRTNKSSNNNISSNNNNELFHVFGPLLNEPQTTTTARRQSASHSHQSHSPEEEDSSFSTSSFSPFPKHCSANNNNGGTNYNNVNGRDISNGRDPEPEWYGENTPLSNLASSSYNNGQSQSFYNNNSSYAAYNNNGNSNQKSAIDMMKAILSNVSYTISTFYYGDQNQHHQHPYTNTNNINNNPFSNNTLRRQNMMHHANIPDRYNKRFGTTTRRNYIRLIMISATLLFSLSNFIAMWNVPSPTVADSVVVQGAGGSSSLSSAASAVSKSTAVDNAADGGEEEDVVTKKQKQIVLQKMKVAKQHWWNRNHNNKDVVGEEQHDVDTVTTANEGVAQQQHQQAVVSATNGNNNNNNDASSGLSNNSAAAAAANLQGVIVQTQEDGTVLIKLPPPPPPKMGSSSIVNNKEQTPILGSSNSNSKNSNLQHGDNDDGTMYIKLPYTQQQQQQQQESQQHRTLTAEDDGTTMKIQELEPPLRGGAPPQSSSTTAHHHSYYIPKFHPPLPFQSSTTKSQSNNINEQHHNIGIMHKLRLQEFDTWMFKHEKVYSTYEEKEHRFGIWMKNHIRIKEKNEKHGPCRMTGKAVFGHNLFSDLEPEEFQSKFLSGYRGPRHTDHDRGHHSSHKEDTPRSYFRETRAEDRLTPSNMSVKRHPSIQRKLEEHTAMYGTISDEPEEGSSGKSRLHGQKYQTYYFPGFKGCPWWNMSCVLRSMFGYTHHGGVREPIFDGDSYPSALDWREMGVVTDVHSQGSCGACWAITAVETIESANAISSGKLVDLAEEEVIACDGSCEMCNGGWPQNAYEYVIKNNGLPEKSAAYDADWLYTVTAVLAGESYEADEYEMGSYFAQTCPAGYRDGGEGGGSGSGSGKSGDNGYQYDVSYTETTRYAKVKGYGYATDRCVCYTDGSGCDCDDQDEKTAVLNVASYGPAAVCLEASLWQDYEGGIMTSDIGCSSSFLDMNHCVEVVGYAFTDGNSDGDDADANNNKNSGSGSNSGSKDEQREGYWIVKNQWSNYWGMSGYAYLAMGDNTCGILNDMTQVYM